MSVKLPRMRTEMRTTLSVRRAGSTTRVDQLAQLKDPHIYQGALSLAPPSPPETFPPIALANTIDL